MHPLVAYIQFGRVVSWARSDKVTLILNLKKNVFLTNILSWKCTPICSGLCLPSSGLCDTFKCRYCIPSLVQIIAFCLFVAKPCSGLTLVYCYLGPSDWIAMTFELNYNSFLRKRNSVLKMATILSEFIIKDCVLQANPVDGQRLVAILRVVPPGAIEILPWWMGLSLPSKYGTPDVESQRM